MPDSPHEERGDQARPPPLRPLPATEQALEEIAETDSGELTSLLVALTQRVQEAVPECIGLSLTLMYDGVTVSLAASRPDLLVLDAVQYLDGGPCDSAAREGEPRLLSADDPTDEQRWSNFSRASSHLGICSTLSLPVYGDEEGSQVIRGSLNVYASESDAFDIGSDRVQQVASLVHATAAEAVRDADLGGRMIAEAQHASGALHDMAVIDLAVGLVAEQDEVQVDVARARLEDAAARAGVSLTELARLLTGDGGERMR